MCFILFRLIITPLVLFLWTRYLRSKLDKRRAKNNEFVHEEASPRVYPGGHVVDAEFKDIK